MTALRRRGRFLNGENRQGLGGTTHDQEKSQKLPIPLRNGCLDLEGREGHWSEKGGER